MPFPTLPVKDGTGTAATINTLPNAGQQAKANSLPVTIASDQEDFILSGGTDRSGTITAGGTAQALAAANPVRRSFTLLNISAGDLWINETGGTAAISGAGSWRVPSGATFQASTASALSIIGATTGQQFTATEV